MLTVSRLTHTTKTMSFYYTLKTLTLRSTNNVNVQIIDDVKGVTLVSCSTLDKDMVAKVKGMTKSEAANAVGKAVAEKALKAGITEVVFDRGGYLYTGRVAKVADGAREAGLKF